MADKPTKLEELHGQFRALSPKGRNDRIQALYSAVVEAMVGEEGEGVDTLTIELLKALAKSFNISLEYDKLDDDDKDDAF